MDISVTAHQEVFSTFSFDKICLKTFLIDKLGNMHCNIILVSIPDLNIELMLGEFQNSEQNI